MRTLKSVSHLVPVITAILLMFSETATGQTNHKSNNNLKGSGAASGGSGSGTVTPDLFTGTMSYAIPIEVAQGRRGLEPALSLTYRSDSKNGWVGVGWELEVGAIERSTKDLNYSDSANNYVVRMAGATGDLVQIPTGEYRAKIEGGFSRIEKVGEHWKMTDKVGTVYRFGFTPDSRQEFTPSPGTVQVFRWSLDQVVDTNGNVMSFTYSKDQGQIYLDRIDYSPNSYVKFYLEDGRPDIPDMYTTKFSVKSAKRLKTIDVFGNGNRVRTYKLNYTQSWPTSQSLLTSVLQFGKDAQVNSVGEIVNELTATKLRPITLGYESSPVPPVSKVLKDPISSTETGSFGGWNHGTGDFNGDGRTDIQLFVANGSGWRSYVALSKGDGTFDPAVSWTDLLNYSGGWIPGTADFNGDGKTDIYVSFAGEAGQGGWKTRVALSNEYGTFGTPIPWGDIHNYTGGWIQGLGDFNGDGKTDISLSVGDVNGWRTHVALSNGDGTFAAPIPWTQPGSFGGWNHGVGDFNGDGKTDLYLYFADGGSWRTHVALSNGDGTFAAEVPWTESDDYSGDWSHGTGDFNGDGKTDISLYVSDSSGGWRVEIAFSKGNGTFSTPVPWSKPGNLGGWHQGIGDFNGDGKTDIFLYFNDVDGWRAHVALSKGDGTFAPPTYWEKVLNYESWGQGSGDFTGDGKTDLHLFAGDSSGWRTYVSASNFGREGLLTSISNGIGGMTTIGYTPSTNYQNTQLPFPVLTLSSITTSTPTLDGTTLTSTTTYSYDGGYYHIPKRDFRGFHHVTATGPAGPDGERTITHTWFHQGDDTAVEANIPGVEVGYMKGKPYRVKVTDGSGAEYSQTDIYYVADGTAPHFNPPARVDNWICEGNSCNSGKKTETYYEGYDDYGNPTVEYQKGNVSDDSDDRTIQRTFTNNDNGKWIVGLPLSEIIYKGHSTNQSDRIAQTDSFYDGAANCSAQSENTNPDKGNLTRVRRWLDGNIYVDARTAFNAYGNPFCTRDANGNISTISYDSSGTFPTIVTNPLGHQTKTAYYGVDGVPADMGLYGQVKSVTDPSNKTSTYQYDSLGRKVRVDSPDGSWGTTSYNNLGEGVGVQHILTNSAAGLSSWSYFDGLGRPVLEKRTGPPGKFIFTKQEYNSNGTIKRSSLPYFQGDTLKWKEFTYDSMGRVTKTVNPDQSTSSATFGLWTVTGVDASGHQKRETRDAFGRLRKVEEFTGIAPAANFYAETYYEYDLLGNLIQVKDAHENKTTMRYDNLGRKIAMSDPDMGSCGDLKTLAPNPTFPWYPVPCWNYFYDANGNLLKQIDAEGSILEFTYDPLNRVRTKAFSDRTPPSAPAGVTATVVSASQIDLSWSASTDNSGVKEYRVDRCNNRPGTPACSNFIQIASLVTTSYSDTGRTDGMDYRYRIRAMDTSGNFGSYSSVATATTPDITPPSTPTGLTAGAFCSNRVDVSWTASTDNVAVTAYQLERCEGSATCTAFVLIATVSAAQTGYNDTGMTPSTIYRYRVKARDAAGHWSGYAMPFSMMTPLPPTAPSGLSAVVGLGAVASSATEVNLAWTAATAPPDNMLSFYEVERSSNNGAFARIAMPTGNSFTNTNLTEGVTYLYRVRAVDCSGGKSVYSNVDMATTIVFTDAEITAGVTVLKAEHFIRLREAVDAIRASMGAPGVAWTDATLVGVVIKSLHLQELRDNLNSALTALGFPTQTFTEPTLTVGVTVKKKVHVEDLREGVK